MINRIFLIGNVGKSVEVHTFDNGTKKASFSLATSETYKTKTGENKTETQWHNIIVFRQLADMVEKWVDKGKQLYIEGKVTYRTYEDKDGNRKGTTEIVADTIRLLGSRKETSDDLPQGDLGTQMSGADQAEAILAQAESEDLPF